MSVCLYLHNIHWWPGAHRLEIAILFCCYYVVHCYVTDSIWVTPHIHSQLNISRTKSGNSASAANGHQLLFPFHSLPPIEPLINKRGGMDFSVLYVYIYLCFCYAMAIVSRSVRQPSIQPKTNSRGRAIRKYRSTNSEFHPDSLNEMQQQQRKMLIYHR